MPWLHADEHADEVGGGRERASRTTTTCGLPMPCHKFELSEISAALGPMSVRICNVATAGIQRDPKMTGTAYGAVMVRIPIDIGMMTDDV